MLHQHEQEGMTNSKEYLKGAKDIECFSTHASNIRRCTNVYLCYSSDRRSDKTIRILSHWTRYRVSDGVYQQLPGRGAGGSRHAAVVESSENRLGRALELYTSGHV